MLHPKGTRVKIRKESQFDGQSNYDGTVFDHHFGWNRVRFDNGYVNAYQFDDLDVLEPRDNEEAMAYLPLF